MKSFTILKVNKNSTNILEQDLLKHENGGIEQAFI